MALCLGTYGDPRGVGVSYERGPQTVGVACGQGRIVMQALTEPLWSVVERHGGERMQEQVSDPEARNPPHETRNLKSEAPNTKKHFRIPNPESRIPNPKQEMTFQTRISNPES